MSWSWSGFILLLLWHLKSPQELANSSCRQQNFCWTNEPTKRRQRLQQPASCAEFTTHCRGKLRRGFVVAGIALEFTGDKGDKSLCYFTIFHLGVWEHEHRFWVSSISGFFGNSVSFSALSLCYAILLWILSSLEFNCVAKNGKSIAIFSPYVLSRPSGKYWVGLPRFAKKMWPMPHMLFTSKTKLCQNMSKPSKYSKKNLGKINCRGSLCLCFDCLLMGSILDTMWVYHFHPSPAWLWPPECKTQAACASFKLRSACAHDEVWKLWKLEISGSIIGSTLKYLVMLHAPWSVISSW